MLAVQTPLPLSKPPRLRSNRRPFHPRPVDGAPYRLPRSVEERLAASLTPYKNRDAALTLATFLARFWSIPSRVATAFPIDRRALAEHKALGLTEARVRGAIRTLVEVGFMDRQEPEPGKRYQRTDEGLHRRAMLFRFGADFLPDFLAANKRAAAARSRRQRQERPRRPATSSRPPVAFPDSAIAKSPKSKSEAERKVLMGDLRKPPSPPAPDPRLEAALERWSRARREERRG